ncbi:hypothetical protein F5Y04DRAFT_260325 [Hypomontagnella monticulosa]|nr:hypothetical protein F5Y04DRAFT_260325 [Hypomontagnella monticulosa]
MASAYDPQGWAKAPAAMAGQVAKAVLKIDSSLNEAKVEKTIKDVLQTILPEYATGQEDGLKQEFENEKKTLENQLEKTQQSLKECQESSNSTKSLLADKETELLGVEERYTDQLKEMKRNHQEQLTRVDDEISAKNKEIDILKRKAADLERDLIKKVNENDVYVKDLESNAEELSEKVRAEGIKLAQAVADCRNTEDELKQERQEAMNAIKKFEMLKAQSKQDQKVQADTTKKVRELETDNIQHQERIQELETDLANRDATIESLKDEISDIERRKRESISFRSSTGSSSGSGGGNLAAELGAVEEPEEVDLRDEYDRQLKKVEKLEKVVGDLETRLKDNEARCKKEREDLRQQLKKANNKADENALEVRRLKSVDVQLKELQKQEQELQSKLKTTTHNLNRAVEELKMLKETVLVSRRRMFVALLLL